MKRKEWPTIEEVKEAGMAKLLEWMRELDAPQTEEEIEIQETISREFVELNR
jgi:glycerol dehydrogenase-like iron-containing ADH family enzyme